VPIGCEHFLVVFLLLFVVVVLTRTEADTMTLRGYNGRKSNPEAIAVVAVAMPTPSVSNAGVNLIIISVLLSAACFKRRTRPYLRMAT
jgi:hypothetical protein